MFNRLRFVFLKRYASVKPVELDKPDTKWLSAMFNVFEEYRDDRLRYGLFVAVQNFVGVVRWRWQVYEARQ